jgi:hypothetical protein
MLSHLGRRHLRQLPCMCLMCLSLGVVAQRSRHGFDVEHQQPLADRRPTAAGGVRPPLPLSEAEAVRLAHERQPTATLSSCPREQPRQDGPGSLSDQPLKIAFEPCSVGVSECRAVSGQCRAVSCSVGAVTGQCRLTLVSGCRAVSEQCRSSVGAVSEQCRSSVGGS